MIVFDRELDDPLRDNRVRVGISIYNSARCSFPDFTKSITGNRLANTAWQSLKDKRITVIFGETSFSLTYLVNGRESRIAGSYKINGDSLTLSGNIPLLGGIEMTGALIGNVITISGLQDGFEFFRVK